MTGWPETTRSMRLDAAALSARSARGILAEVCAEAQMGQETAETAMLLVSELVTNAVTHGDGKPLLDIHVGADQVKVAVSDSAPGAPQVQHGSVLDEGGRGMLLVETLADRWGVEARSPAGKTVWFELDRS